MNDEETINLLICMNSNNPEESQAAENAFVELSENRIDELIYGLYHISTQEQYKKYDFHVIIRSAYLFFKFTAGMESNLLLYNLFIYSFQNHTHFDYILGIYEKYIWSCFQNESLFSIWPTLFTDILSLFSEGHHLEVLTFFDMLLSYIPSNAESEQLYIIIRGTDISLFNEFEKKAALSFIVSFIRTHTTYFSDFNDYLQLISDCINDLTFFHVVHMIPQILVISQNPDLSNIVFDRLIHIMSTENSDPEIPYRASGHFSNVFNSSEMLLQKTEENFLDIFNILFILLGNPSPEFYSCAEECIDIIINEMTLLWKNDSQAHLNEIWENDELMDNHYAKSYMLKHVFGRSELFDYLIEGDLKMQYNALIAIRQNIKHSFETISPTFCDLLPILFTIEVPENRELPWKLICNIFNSKIGDVEEYATEFLYKIDQESGIWEYIIAGYASYYNKDVIVDVINKLMDFYELEITGKEKNAILKSINHAVCCLKEEEYLPFKHEILQKLFEKLDEDPRLVFSQLYCYLLGTMSETDREIIDTSVALMAQQLQINVEIGIAPLESLGNSDQFQIEETYDPSKVYFMDISVFNFLTQSLFELTDFVSEFRLFSPINIATLVGPLCKYACLSGFRDVYELANHCLTDLIFVIPDNIEILQFVLENTRKSPKCQRHSKLLENLSSSIISDNPEFAHEIIDRSIDIINSISTIYILIQQNGISWNSAEEFERIEMAQFAAYAIRNCCVKHPTLCLEVDEKLHLAIPGPECDELPDPLLLTAFIIWNGRILGIENFYGLTQQFIEAIYYHIPSLSTDMLEIISAEFVAIGVCPRLGVNEIFDYVTHLAEITDSIEDKDKEEYLWAVNILYDIIYAILASRWGLQSMDEPVFEWGDYLEWSYQMIHIAIDKSPQSGREHELEILEAKHSQTQ